MGRFEVGVVYRKPGRRGGGRPYLAVGEEELLSFRNGKPFYLSPAGRFQVLRGISVEQLCERWRISIDDLDRVSDDQARRAVVPKDAVPDSPRETPWEPRRVKVRA